MKTIVVPREKITNQLVEAFSEIQEDVVVFHTDLMRIGIIDEVKPREQLLSDYWSLMQEVAGDRCILFPTFNYRFCRDGVYDVGTAPAEVGVLNEYVRSLHPDLRSRTPVFNFCILNNVDFPLSAVANPFSIESTFGDLVKHAARIVFFGSGLHGNTFIHHVEELMDIGYRYIKPFPGEILDIDGSRQRITLQYRVRPLEGGVSYDWSRLETNLVSEGILEKRPLGNGELMHYRADQLLDHWTEKLREDELYLLTPDSKGEVGVLFEKYGYPLTFENVEG
ncbi:MAG: AAC(3) family N-acetyltransferase, partial [Anaerolineales bacterium]